MRLLTVGENEAGQRLLRLLEKYMDKAPKSFFYKMLRKKNITLNGKKAQGNEYLSKGDEIRLFLSDETIDGFSSAAGRGMPGMNSLAGSEVPRGEALRGGQLPPRQKSTQKLTEKLPENLRPEIIYEDRHVILFNKPAGLLSQKAVPSDVSLVEYLTAYLLESGQIAEEELRSFRPGICSRLDRNTSGLVAAGKSLRGLQELNELFRTRSLHKFYRTIAVGTIAETRRAEGWLLKNERTNQVQILREKREGALPICTEYRPLEQFRLFGKMFAYLEINLLTGRSHQIRAHLASLGHPLIGDAKYGKPEINRLFSREFGLKYQLLHAYRLEFPELSDALAEVSGRSFTAPLPAVFSEILQSRQNG